MKLDLGDVIQIDGGQAIVTQIKGDKALIAPLGDFKGRSAHALKNGIEAEIARNRVINRLGAEGLAEFLKEQKEAKHQDRRGLFKLEDGDNICYQGAICIVYSTSAKKARIAHPDGGFFEEDRWINETFLACGCHKLERLTAEEREANLKAFLARPKTKPTEAAKPEPKPAGIEGRLEYVAELVAANHQNDEQIIQAIKERYPMTTPGYARQLIEGRRKKLKATK